MTDARLLVGPGTSDDAAVVAWDEERALVQTLDFITPVVDDPRMYGRIAAANSLSDIFAMGADVLTAMNIVGFDGCRFGHEVLAEILAGGMEKVKEAGGILAGGHTIETPEMLYGLSVTGTVHPDRIWRNDTPEPGDALILTKPLGGGMLATAIKAQMTDAGQVDEVSHMMARLNLYAADAAKSFTVHACTDITGFGLAGHAVEMAGGGKVTLAVDYDALPVYESALEMAAMGMIPEGTYTNRETYGDKVRWGREVEEPMLVFDAQTSGGLLLSVPRKEAMTLLGRIRDGGDEAADIVGEVIPFAGYELYIR